MFVKRVWWSRGQILPAIRSCTHTGTHRGYQLGIRVESMRGHIMLWVEIWEPRLSHCAVVSIRLAPFAEFIFHIQSRTLFLAFGLL